MATVAEMGTQEWMARELTTIRAAVSSYVHDNLPVSEEWTRSDITTWLVSQQPAVRTLIVAAFDGGEPAVDGLLSYAQTGTIYAF